MRRAEGRRRERRPTIGQAVAGAVQPELVSDELRQGAAAAHALASTSATELAVMAAGNRAHDLVLGRRRVAIEPVAEEVLHGVRQAHDRIGGGARAVVGGGLQDGRHFMVVEAGDQRGDVDGHGNAGIGQGPDRRQSCPGHAGARLEGGGKVLLEGGQRDGDGGGVVAREILKDVDIAGNQAVLGDDGYRIAEFSEHLQAGTGDAKSALGGLIAVGDAAEIEYLRLPTG